MAAKLMDGIGLVSGVLGIVGFIQDNVPDDPPEGANIRVKLGLGDDDNHGIEGNIGATYAWDTNNNYIGKSGGAEIGEPGDTHDFTIDQFSPGTRAEYVGVAAEKNAVCIAWITVKMHDETKGGSWTGDVGAECGQDWFHQTEMAGYLDKDAEHPKERYIPKCTWLDEDHSNDIPTAALKFKTMAYGETAEDTVGQNKACDFTKWGPDNGPINDKPGKRAPRPRQKWMEDRLIMSNISQHTAESLCSSATSYGPDFVGSDGLFCDMHTKTLTPLCSTKQVDGCLNVDAEGKVITKRSSVAKRQVETKHKSYAKISHWE